MLAYVRIIHILTIAWNSVIIYVHVSQRYNTRVWDMGDRVYLAYYALVSCIRNVVKNFTSIKRVGRIRFDLRSKNLRVFADRLMLFPLVFHTSQYALINGRRSSMPNPKVAVIDWWKGHFSEWLKRFPLIISPPLTLYVGYFQFNLF